MKKSKDKYIEVWQIRNEYNYGYFVETPEELIGELKNMEPLDEFIISKTTIKIEDFEKMGEFQGW